MTPAYVLPYFKVDEGEDSRGRYREVVGSLMWLSSSTRPDIADDVRAASRHDENPTAEDWHEVSRIFEIPRTAADLRITHVMGSSHEFGPYADGDYAKFDDRRSVSR